MTVKRLGSSAICAWVTTVLLFIVSDWSSELEGAFLLAAKISGSVGIGVSILFLNRLHVGYKVVIIEERKSWVKVRSPSLTILVAIIIVLVLSVMAWGDRFTPILKTACSVGCLVTVGILWRRVIIVTSVNAATSIFFAFTLTASAVACSSLPGPWQPLSPPLVVLAGLKFDSALRAILDSLDHRVEDNAGCYRRVNL